MEPYKDKRDILLEYLLKNDLSPTYDGKSSEELSMTPSEIDKALKSIRIEKPNWLITGSVVGGPTATIQRKEYKPDIEKFLVSGGFTKEEYAKPVTDEEQLTWLEYLYTHNKKMANNWDLWKQPYNRFRKVFEKMQFLGLIEEDQDNKTDKRYKLSQEGINAHHEGKIPNKNTQPFASNIHIERNEGAIAFPGGSATQNNFGDNAKVENSQIGNENRQELSDKKPWWREVTIQVAVGLIVVFIAWFFGCNH